MSKSSPRLSRPGSAGSKSPGLRKEMHGNRSCMLRIGERLMRAGSEGNLIQRPIPGPGQNRMPTDQSGQRSNGGTQPAALEDHGKERNDCSKDPGNSPSRASSSSSSSTAGDSSTEHLLQKKPYNNSSSSSGGGGGGGPTCNPDFPPHGPAPHSPSTLPRSYASSSFSSSTCSRDRDSQLDRLMMQQSDVERKKEVFLDHLRQKYPHHAAILMGHHEVRSLRPSEGGPYTGVQGLVEEQDPLVPDTMSDGEVLPPSVPFTRGTKARASLPAGRSSGQSRERPLGVLYLQYGEETKQVCMPSELSSADALRALFVTAFPHQLTMKMLQSPNMAIYTKDTNRNVYYNLEDVRNITPHSCLKAYHKDPAHVFNRHARPANAEGRISKEVLYGNHSPVHSLASSSRSTLHSLQGSMSPPMVRSMPSSPSRMAYGGGGARGRGASLTESLSGSGRSGSVSSSSSSAILERRDVKPDDDAASCKSLALVVRGDGAASHYADSYCSSVTDGGRLSLASSQCSGPTSLSGDVVDTGALGGPPGLQQYRASVKPLVGYGENLEQQTCSLHRQKNRKYGDSQLTSLGTKTPPASPHRVNEVRMTEGQIIGGVGLVSPDRMSPLRRSLRRDSNGATVEVLNRSRGSCSSTSSVFVDSPLGQSERQFQAFGTPTSAQTERMKAMEEQIASLAGLVHHALSMGPEVKEAVSESAGRTQYIKQPGGLMESQDPKARSPAPLPPLSPGPPPPLSPPSDGGLQWRLVSAKRNVCELREQLNQLKRLQLSNQKTVSSMLRMAGQELVGLMCNRLAQVEEAVDPHRAEMEEERISYLATEDKILSQLSELENYVDRLQRCSGSGSSPGQTSLTLRDVEEGAVNLRRVGEALAVLKGEYPELQVKMRSVLRLEVEAVRFLKEEPHKMDSMLKRVRALTETLGSLRRHVSESTPPARSAQAEPPKLPEADQQPPTTASPQSSPRPQPRSSVRPPHLLPGAQAELASVGSASPIMARRRKGTVGTGAQAPHHCPSPPLTPTHGRDSPSVAKVSPRSREGSPALQRRTDQQQEDTPDMCTHMATERLTPEGGQREETLSAHTKQPASSDSRQTRPTSTSTDLDQVLRMAQESLMEAIPDLEVPDPAAGGRLESAASGQPTSPRESKSEQEAPLNLAPQAAVEQQACLSNAQVDVPPKPSAEVNSTHLKAADAVSKEPSPSAPPPAAPSASPVPERRPQVEKPRRSSVDKEMKQNLERASKSPPPPPPRRLHSASSAHTAPVRSEEVVPATRTEPVGAQAETPKVKEPPVVPQPKPPRQPPEVKPKPQMCAAVLQAAAASAQREKQQQQEQQEEEDEEEEDNKFMKELQVTTKILDTSDSSSGNKQKEQGKAVTASTLQSANQKCSDSNVSGHQPSAHMVKTNGFPGKVVGATVPAEHTDSGESREGFTEKTLGKQALPETLRKAETQQPMVQSNHGMAELSTPTKEQAVNMESPPVPASPAANGRAGVISPTRSPKDVVEQLFSPTTAEKKVKFTTIVTLQKENPRELERSPKTTNETAAGDAPAEKKSNMTVVVTLEKEKPPQVGLPGALLEEKSVSSSQESTEVEKPPPLLPRSPQNHSSNQPIQEGPGQVFTDQSLNSEEGCTLSPAGCNDEGPPPPPPAIGKFTHRMSKTKKKTKFKEDDLARTNGSGTQTGPGDSSDDIIYVGLENPGFKESDEFDSKPIIVFLNEPMDLQSAYKRLSTIFESEEDLERILAPESFLDEEESYEEGNEPAVRTFHFGEANKKLGNGQGAPQTPRERPASDVSVPGDQDKPDALEKTETKRKFKFKFPKNKLAAISHAIRTGTNKSGKKTVEVVVYEEEEETGPGSRSVRDAKTPTKDHKNVEIISSKKFSLDKTNVKDKDVKASPTKSPSKTEELRKNTLETMDSLEESIKQLELSVDSITSPSSTVSSPPQSPNSPVDGTARSHFKGKARKDRERSPSKRPAAQILKGPNPPQSKRAKPQPAEDAQQKTSSKKQTSSSTSSPLRSNTKSRHSSSSGSPEKSSKTPPKQPSQADGRRAAGASERCAVALRGSKIPALCHSSGKQPCASPSTAHCSDPTSSTSSTSSSTSSSASSPPASSASSSSCGKLFLLSPPSNASEGAPRPPAAPCPLSSSTSSCASPPPCPSSPSSPSFSPSRRSHKSFIPSLNLSRLLPSSSHVLLPSRANASPPRPGPRGGTSTSTSTSSSSTKRQQNLVLPSTSTSTPSTTSQHNYYSSSSYSSSSPSSSTSSSLSPTSSSSSPPSPSSSLLPATAGPGGRTLRASASHPASPARSKKRTGSQAVRAQRTVATASKEAA